MFSDSSSFPGETYVFMKAREWEGRVYRSGLVLKWRSGEIYVHDKEFETLPEAVTSVAEPQRRVHE